MTNEEIQEYIASNPILIGLLDILLGIFLLLAAIFDWNFIFGNVNRFNYSLKKLDGIINMFGRKTARLFCGMFSVFLIAIGLIFVWAILYTI